MRERWRRCSTCEVTTQLLAGNTNPECEDCGGVGTVPRCPQVGDMVQHVEGGRVSPLQVLATRRAGQVVSVDGWLIRTPVTSAKAPWRRRWSPRWVEGVQGPTRSRDASGPCWRWRVG